MQTIIKAFTILKTAEGKRISYVYTEVDENGDIIKENVNESFVVVNTDLMNNVESIFDFLYNRKVKNL